MTRAEHLEWCKERALELSETGDLAGAFASMASDLKKHPETARHLGMELGMRLLMSGHLATKKQMDDFITGFN